MMSKSVEIEHYITKMGRIQQGERNNELYRLGLRIRGEFGLSEAALEVQLQRINQEKCEPPLNESEVKKICHSVDRAKVQIGERNNEHNTQKIYRKPPMSQTKVVTVLTHSESAVAVPTLLQKNVSTYDNCLANVPSDTYKIGEMLESFRTSEEIKTQIAEIRAEQDKEKRSELKKKLAAVIFGSEPQTERNNDAPVDKLESAKSQIAAVPYVFAVGLSASGRGFFALAHYEGTPDLKTLLAAMQSDFPYELDKSRSDLCGLRYITFDENLIVKDEVFAAILTERHEVEGEIVRCGIEALDNILIKIEPVDWKEHNEKVYILRTVEQVLLTADKEATPLICHADGIHYFTGTHYMLVGTKQLANFLIEAAVQCDVPPDVAEFHTFVDKLVKQFLISSSRHHSRVNVPTTPFINLKNGTLFFNGRERRFEKHSHQRFIQYCLDFEYDPHATAPLWQKHLDRSLPNPEKQMYLAKCLALPFYPGKIEKAPILDGQRDTGKSTTLDVYKELLGKDNIVTETLSALSRDDTQGAYARARLDGKLVNIASDVSPKINDGGLTKMLISREEVSARHPYGHGFDLRNYARVIFAMNDLPPQFFTDAALAKRAAIIYFDQQIRSEDKDTDFAAKVIATELPGILNWIIDGLDELLLTGRLDPPACCVEEVTQLRTELDPLSSWLASNDLQKGHSHFIKVGTAYELFGAFCKLNGYQALSTRTFSSRLRDLGYCVERSNGHIGTVLYYAKSMPDSRAPQSPHSPTLENKAESDAFAGNDGAQAPNLPTPSDDSLPDHSPLHSPLVPTFEPAKTGPGSMGIEGNERSEQSTASQQATNPTSKPVSTPDRPFRRTLPISQTMRIVNRPGE